jgi:AcrR family transcriptional regulator
MDDPPRRGRHNEATRNDEALLDAARVVFAVHGADAPVALIAERAGTGIGSLYRRYPTKEALLQHLCLSSMRQTIDAATAALTDDDPWLGVQDFLHTCADHRYGAFTAIAGTITTTAEMNQTFKQSHELLDEIVARAQASRQLRADVSSIDLRLLIELFSRRPADDETFRRSLAIAIDGLHQRPDNDTLPGDPPSWRDYVDRWRSSPT